MSITRRRFLGIAAAGTAAGLAALGGGAPAAARVVWQGVALGAPAMIVLDGEARDAQRLIRTVPDEIARLEGLFSLYRADSAISRLNRAGRLDDPDPDFLALLSAADRVHRASRGAFDPTIQAEWAKYAEILQGGTAWHRVRPGRRWPGVRYAPGLIRFDRPGMAITLNGIAQGFITDRIAALLHQGGLRHVLVDMGEPRALGARADGTPWPVRIAGPDGRTGENTVHLRGGRAIAVSVSKGTTFDAAGRYGHIIDPATGRAASTQRMVAVEAASATLADGLSTALCLVPPGQAGAVLDRFPDARLAG